MKALVYIVCLGIGMFLGMYGGLTKPKPTWWKFTAIGLILLSSIITLFPKIGANYDVADYMFSMAPNHKLPVHVYLNEKTLQNDENGKSFLKIYDHKDDNKSYRKMIADESILSQLNNSNHFILNVVKQDSNYYKFVSIEAESPLVVLPYVIGLEQKIKIMPFHVPVAWVSVLAYLISMIFGVMYLKKKDIKYDYITLAAASLGLVYTVLATTTGMIWAKFNWGSFWNWDPRETSIFFLLLIYSAYFALRSAIEREDLRARISAVYSIIAFVTVPFFIFILPRITSGLHPGSQGEANSGPVLTSQAGMLDSFLMFGFGLGLTSFTVMFFWLLNLQIRYIKLKNKHIG